MKTLDSKYIINKMKEMEPNYNFDHFEYIRNDIKSTIICDKGHEYKACWNKFKYGRRCPVCAKEKSSLKQRLSEDKVINYMQEQEPNYDFSKFKYKNARTKSIIICDKGHEYETAYDNFKQGRRCPKCSKNLKREYGLRKINQLRKLTQEEAIKRMQEQEPNYDFSKFVYTKAIDKSIIICDKGHEYISSYTNFYNKKRRCPKCWTPKSRPETEIIDFIKTFYNGTIEQSNRNIIPSLKRDGFFLELDIYLPELNKAIEFNGRYFHTDEMANEKGFSNIEEYHTYKFECCKAKGIELLHIFEDKWIEDKERELLKIQEFLK